MGKGVALMFKERFPENYQAYAAACAAGKVRVGGNVRHGRCGTRRPALDHQFPDKATLTAASLKTRMGAGWFDGFEGGHSRKSNPVHRHSAARLRQRRLGLGRGASALIEATMNDLSGVEVLIFEPAEKYHLQTAVIAK